MRELLEDVMWRLQLRFATPLFYLRRGVAAAVGTIVAAGALQVVGVSANASVLLGGIVALAFVLGIPLHLLYLLANATDWHNREERSLFEQVRRPWEDRIR